MTKLCHLVIEEGIRTWDNSSRRAQVKYLETPIIKKRNPVGVPLSSRRLRKLKSLTFSKVYFYFSPFKVYFYLSPVKNTLRVLPAMFGYDSSIKLRVSIISLRTDTHAHEHQKAHCFQIQICSMHLLLSYMYSTCAFWYVYSIFDIVNLWLWIKCETNLFGKDVFPALCL